jgi:hypothetical protein
MDLVAALGWSTRPRSHHGDNEEELLAPDQPYRVAEVDDVLKEATEDGQPQAMSDSGEG